MADAAALWTLLQDAADPSVTKTLKSAVETGLDHDLTRMNPLAFAADNKLDEDATIATLSQAARIGVFDMSWSVVCPGCRGVLETGMALKALHKDQYFCVL